MDWWKKDDEQEQLELFPKNDQDKIDLIFLKMLACAIGIGLTIILITQYLID